MNMRSARVQSQRLMVGYTPFVVAILSVLNDTDSLGLEGERLRWMFGLLASTAPGVGPCLEGRGMGQELQAPAMGQVLADLGDNERATSYLTVRSRNSGILKSSSGLFGRSASVLLLRRQSSATSRKAVASSLVLTGSTVSSMGDGRAKSEYFCSRSS